MSEQVHSFCNTGRYQTNSKMGPDIGPKKTMIVVVIVVGCFAVLWPKVFHPMFFGTVEQHLKPSAIDKTTGCCDVFSETDINTIKIMSELCSTIIEKDSDKPLPGKEIVSRCKSEILKTCGIDISAVLQEKVRLGTTVKQILNDVRSLNGSLCLKYNYGIAPWKIGAPHRILTNFKPTSVRQERPPHMRAEMMHPAFRERGSAIPRTQAPPQTKGPGSRIVEGRPGPIPGMRPPMGGAGHVVPPSQKGSSMGIIMPIYTIGIVIFFTYTLMKLLFKKQPDGVGGSLYPPVEPDPQFRKDVFESQMAPRLSRDASSKIVVNAMSALLDEVDEELETRRKANEVANQEPNVNISNGSVKTKEVEPDPEPEPEQPTVKIVGMETTASCEGGQKWNLPKTTVLPQTPPAQLPLEIKEPPQEIYLEGALPAQSRLLVSDAKTETKTNEDSEDDDPAVVLAGKMTLSVISLDSLVDESKDKEVEIEEVEDEEESEEEIIEEIEEIIEINGDDEVVTESKYTTASSATAAEPEVSDEEVDTDDEHEDVLIEDIEVNHVKSESEIEE